MILISFSRRIHRTFYRIYCCTGPRASDAASYMDQNCMYALEEKYALVYNP